MNETLGHLLGISYSEEGKRGRGREGESGQGDGKEKKKDLSAVQKRQVSFDAAFHPGQRRRSLEPLIYLKRMESVCQQRAGHAT